MFLQQFERMLIDQIVRQKANLFGLNEVTGSEVPKVKLNPVQEIYVVAVKFYDKQLLEHELARSLNRALDQGFTYSYSLVSDSESQSESMKQLRQMLDRYKSREYGKAVFASDFHKLVKLIAQSSPETVVDGEPCVVKAALLLIYDVLIAKENARRKREYQTSHGQRDGIDCLNYFLDLINHCAGYSDKYYGEHNKRISNAELIEKYRNEREKHEATNFKESELLADKYPHCLLVLEGV